MKSKTTPVPWVRWATAFGFVGFIYATLGSVRGPTGFLRSHGLLRLSLLSLYLSSFGFFLIVLLRQTTRDVWRFAGLIGCFFLYFLSTKEAGILGEKFRTAGYGALGTLPTWILPWAKDISPHALSYLTLIIFFILYALFFSLLIRALINDKNPLIATLALGGIFVQYWLVGPLPGSPEEEIHFLEYGLVGILFLRAFFLHFKNARTAFVAAFLLGSLCGTLDEFIQKLIPSRTFDTNDIILNLISVQMGLVIYSICVRGPFSEEKN